MQIVVEYSKAQNAFHRCTVKEREQNELFLKLNDMESDYNIIGSFSTTEAADKFIAENYELIKNSRMYKNDKGELFVI